MREDGHRSKIGWRTRKHRSLPIGAWSIKDVADAPEREPVSAARRAGPVRESGPEQSGRHAMPGAARLGPNTGFAGTASIRTMLLRPMLLRPMLLRPMLLRSMLLRPMLLRQARGRAGAGFDPVKHAFEWPGFRRLKVESSGFEREHGRDAAVFGNGVPRTGRPPPAIASAASPGDCVRAMMTHERPFRRQGSIGRKRPGVRCPGRNRAGQHNRH